MLKGFADRPGARYERKRKIRDATGFFSLSNWKDRVILNIDGKTTETFEDYRG